MRIQLYANFRTQLPIGDEGALRRDSSKPKDQTMNPRQGITSPTGSKKILTDPQRSILPQVTPNSTKNTKSVRIELDQARSPDPHTSNSAEKFMADSTMNFESLRKEITGNAKLPGLTELVNTKNKPNEIDVSQSLIDLTKYAQSLEHIIRFKNREIQRLEYLNKYLVIAQQKRDEMLTHTLEENRKLKELTIRNEKKYIEKRQKRQSLGEIAISGPKVTFNPTFKQTPIHNVAIEQHPRKKYSSMSNDSHKVGIQKQTVKYVDEKKSQSILKMNEVDAYALYTENENLKFMENLVSDEENFIQKIRSWNEDLLISVYIAIENLLKENRNLFGIVMKLKKIIKAANMMSDSLVLNEAMEEIVEQICSCLNCDRATLWIVDEDKEELWSKVAKGSEETIRMPWNKGIAGLVAQKKESLNILNAYSDQRFNREVDLSTNYKTNTILCVPIFEERKGTSSSSVVIGVVQAINKFEGVFNKDDEGLLSILAQLAGIIIRNSMTFNQERSFHGNLRAILDTGIHLNSVFGMPQLLPRAEKKLKAIMNVEKARIFVLDKEKDVLFRYSEDGKREEFPPSSGIVGAAVEKKAPENTANGYNDPLFNRLIDIETSMPLITWPLRNLSNEEDIIGVFQAINLHGIRGLVHSSKPKLNMLERESLDFFSKQLTQAIINNFFYEGFNLEGAETNVLEVQRAISRVKTQIFSGVSPRTKKDVTDNSIKIE